ncbi:flagellar biosynthesis protein FlhF [Pandoraea nosoerga]|uniref:Flagellar biosynthesis protein FlhF n=1 Tax=Pandoraea nosoerga TaxID=2508296 RepID=A0A5E4XW94_9BURK|nr:MULTISPECIES: flagellar biosynthesis protein FlhF [Pandoraea]MBN4664820.1 flagellar biosynthesis protein FlhF [Pandoraea nosoerga]MBN4674005.1 flagellar biosynthesis protein FlhF [Pandoraea nosoerga]MBN4680060.1 flagellar biosynthesis protein FlhF [Pandoraea nosoerga]MBN4744228.1 flagellar biosynthesis protein FlhF [Pandoraea nosoerga]VVE40600.1 flagellar biosynthesis protein FlhF [Pandoraea nosoerga]
MKIRKFFAGTCRDALRQIREEIGPDAVVLSNRSVANGVEIVALAEEDLDALAGGDMPTYRPRPRPAPAAPPAAAAAAQDIAAASAFAQSMMGELQSMRGLLEEQVAGLVWNDKRRRSPAQGEILRTLLAAGFSAQLGRALLEHLPEGSGREPGLEWVKNALKRNLPVMANEDELMERGGVYALMGPTGVGKTTTTAKLAARCVMRHGAEKLALLTTDSYRIGGHEQLRIYGKILGVTVHAVKDATDLRLALTELRNKHMVLIDTVGMSQRDRTVPEQVAMLCGAHTPVQRLLLLNATSHGDTLNEVVHAYRSASAQGGDLAGCILTKLDETTNLGSVLDTVIRHRLPVHYVSTGQRVPENLHVAEREFLIETALSAPVTGSPFVPAEEDLPAVVRGVDPNYSGLFAPAQSSGEACFG